MNHKMLPYLMHSEIDYVARGIAGLLRSEEGLTSRIDVKGFSFSRDLGVDAGRMHKVSDCGFNSDDYRRFELDYYGNALGLVVFRMYRFPDMELRDRDNLFPSGWHNNFLIIGTGDVEKQDLSMIIEFERCLRKDEQNRTEFFLDHIPQGAIKPRHGNRFRAFLHEKAPYLFDKEGVIMLGRILMGMALSINDDVVVEFFLRCAIVAYYEKQYLSQKKRKPQSARIIRRIVNTVKRQPQ